ncbi:hypothetical protein NZK32_11660 [Cyanobium sp. FGCU-52]|nr:hypothetical protein [Cyanobium sp. FGCU52]
MIDRAALPSFLWFSQRTAQSLSGASAGWLLSGLTQAPLVNGLLPALSVSTTLLPLRPRARFGLVLQVVGLLVLLAVALKRLGPSPVWPLLASGLVGVGRTASVLPLQRWLLAPRRLNLPWLQRLGDAGGLAGSLLTALLFPLLRNTAPQFAVAALLLMPVLLVVSSPRFQLREGATPTAPLATPVAAAGIDLRGGFQGLLFGGLFALLPLWVRAIGGGSCVDFGLVLAAYGLGRILSLPLPLPGWGLYGGMAVLLQATTWLPAWGATALFVPLGALAAGSDVRQVAALSDAAKADDAGDTAAQLARIDRSRAIGSLVGSLALGAGTQILGLTNARILIVAAFLLAAVLLPHRRNAAA